MKKILTIPLLGRAAAVAAAASPAAAATTPAVTAPPFQGEKPLALALSVDTVVSGSAANKQLEPLGGCAETSTFHVGQTIVFRMWGVDVKTGGTALTEKIVEPEKGAYVVIANMLLNGVPSTVRIPLLWGEHVKSKTEESVKHSYWTVGVPTKGEVKEPGGNVESATGTLTPVAEKTKVELQATAPNPVNFSIHVVTKSVVTETIVKKKVTKKGKNGKKTVVIKKVKKKVTEPGQTGEFTEANFPISSQLMLEK